MGRPKKWNPSPFTARERITGHMLRCKYGPNMQTELRVKKDFGDLCRMNHCTPEDAYVPFIGQMRVAGMSAGTIREYVGHVVKGKRSTAAYIALRTAESLQTDSPVVHAADTDQEHIESLIAKKDKGFDESPSMADDGDGCPIQGRVTFTCSMLQKEIKEIHGHPVLLDKRDQALAAPT